MKFGHYRGSSSVGRATAFQAVGRGFEPRLPLYSAEASAMADLGFGSTLFIRGKHTEVFADVAQLVEHVLGKDGVTGSIPVSSLLETSRIKCARQLL